MEDIQKEFEEIWNSNFFKNGKNCIWVYNYDLFRIYDKAEFEENNLTPIRENKLMFAEGGTSPDDASSYLLIDTVTKSIFVMSNYTHIEPVEPRLISSSIKELFNKENSPNIFIEKFDTDFWNWNESVFYNSEGEIIKEVPNGVIPNFDLRYYFKNDIPNTFLLDQKETNSNAVLEYFKENGVENKVPSDFFENMILPETMYKLTASINEKISEEVFYSALFLPSNFYGIGNWKSLSETQKIDIERYGIIIKKPLF